MQMYGGVNIQRETATLLVAFHNFAKTLNKLSVKMRGLRT